MYPNHRVDIPSIRQPSLAQRTHSSHPLEPTDQTSAEKIGLACARRFRFAPDARINGFLLQADIGPISYGNLHGNDLPAESNFVKFEAIGFDHRGGYDIVRSAAGVAFVIVTYAPHALERRLSLLQEHIGANPDYYAVRSLILGTPWSHGQTMLDELKAGWERCLSAPAAQERSDMLSLALAKLKSS